MQELQDLQPGPRLCYPRPSRLIGHFANSHGEKHATDSEEGNENDRERGVRLYLIIQLPSIQPWTTLWVRSEGATPNMHHSGIQSCSGLRG
jgi:hypothetical protein